MACLTGARFSKKILGSTWEDLRKFLRLMKILGKTYDNADFRKILRKTYDHCKAVLGNYKIDYIVVLYVNKNNNSGIHTFAVRRK